MKKLLMICYYYPPLVDVGSLRSIAFSRGLPALGWSPTVITISNPYKSYCRLGNTVPPEGISVYRAPCLFDALAPIHLANGIYDRIRRMLHVPPSYSLFVWGVNLWLPDLFAPWIIGAVRAAVKIKDTGFDAIYASCSPFSSAVIGVILKGILKKPLILDFRDPMTKRILRKRETLADLMRQKIEHHVLRECDHLILLTRESRDRYVSAYPFLAGKVSVIHNGYHESFIGAKQEGLRKNSRFTITYTGSFYQEIIAPEPFFNALRIALDRGWISEKRILFRYVGEPGDWFGRLVAERSLDSFTEVTGYVPHEQVRSYVSESDIVLLRGLDPCCLPTKLYEGLALGKPFLALTGPGEVADMLRMYAPTYSIVHPLDEEAIAVSIRDLFGLWEANLLKDAVSEEYLSAFRWENLTFKMSRVIDGVCRGSESYSREVQHAT